MKFRYLLCLCAVFCVLLCSVSCKNQIDVDNDPNTVTGIDHTEPEPDRDLSLQITEGVYIEELFSYSGEYVEDGSSEPCENIAAVRLVNDSDVHYQYLQFNVNTAEATYSFTATTLFAGAVMTVLDQSKTVFTDGQIVSVKADSVAPFTQQPTVHLETFEISYLDGIINVRNLTDQDLNDVYVYYKNVEDDVYFGGITYRCNVGTVAGTTTVQSGAANLHKDSSRIVFVTFAEQQ